MAETIEITKEDIEKLKNQLETAGEEFKTNYNKLTALIEQIRRGDFTGEAADLFLQKYEEKKDFFDGINKILEDAEKYTNDVLNKYETLNAQLMHTFC